MKDFHPTVIRFFSHEFTPIQVAGAVAELRYDALSEFFEELRGQFLASSSADEQAERPILAVLSKLLAFNCQAAKVACDAAWRICVVKNRF